MIDQKIGQRVAEASQMNKNILDSHLKKNIQVYQNILLAVEKSTRGLFTQIPSGEMIQKIIKSNIQDIHQASLSSKGILEILNQTILELKADQNDFDQKLENISNSIKSLNEPSDQKSFVFRPKLKKKSNSSA